jgi:hypothetical protein
MHGHDPKDERHHWHKTAQHKRSKCAESGEPFRTDLSGQAVFFREHSSYPAFRSAVTSSTARFKIRTIKTFCGIDLTDLFTFAFRFRFDVPRFDLFESSVIVAFGTSAKEI